MVVALAAERLSAAPHGIDTPLRGVDAGGDISAYLSPVAGDAGAQRSDVRVARDPFADVVDIDAQVVAQAAATPTVNASRRPARQLTAILIADDRPIAVIDGEVVKVGDVLPDGATVASIREDRVSLRERDGRWRVVTLPAGRP